MSTFPLKNESARFCIKCANSSVPSRLLDDEHHWGDYLPWLWQSFQRGKSFEKTFSTVPQEKRVWLPHRNFHLTRNSLMSPWPVRMVRWWKPTKWSWLAPVTNKPSLAGKGWGFLKCFGRTEECWHQNWVYAGFLLATLYTSWTVWWMVACAVFIVSIFSNGLSTMLYYQRLFWCWKSILPANEIESYYCRLV